MSKLNKEPNYDSVDRYGAQKNNQQTNFMRYRNNSNSQMLSGSKNKRNQNKNADMAYPSRLVQSNSQQYLRPHKLPYIQDETQELGFQNNNDDMYRHQNQSTGPSRGTTDQPGRINSQQRIQIKIDQYKGYIEQLQRAQLRGESQYDFSNYQDDSYRSPTWQNERASHFEKRQRYLNRNRVYMHSQPQLMGLIPQRLESVPYLPDVDEMNILQNTMEPQSLGYGENLLETDLYQGQLRREEIETINIMRKNRGKMVPQTLHQQSYQQMQNSRQATPKSDYFNNRQFNASGNLAQSSIDRSLRKPPLVLNSNLAKKKQKLKELMDSHGPSSRVGENELAHTPQEKVSRHFTFNVDDRNSEEYYLEHEFQRAQFSLQPRRRQRSPRSRKHVIDLWEYITRKIMMKQNNNNNRRGNKNQQVYKNESSNEDNLATIEGQKMPILPFQNGNRAIDNWTRLIAQAEVRTKAYKIAAFRHNLDEFYEKEQELRILGRWSILINRGLAKKNSRNFRVQKNWRKLVRGAANYYQAYELQTVTHMIEQLEDKNAKIESMGQIGKWRIFINGIKSRSREGVKLRHLEICGRWSRLARRMLRHQANLSRLNAIGKWGYLTEVLLKKSVSMSHFQQLKRWKILVKGMHVQDPRSFALRKMQVINTEEMIEKLETAQAKTEELRHVGRWNILTRGLLKKNYDENVLPEKQRLLALYGRWNRLIMGQNTKYNKRQALKISMQWTYLTKRILQEHNKKWAFEKKFKWVNMARRYIFYRKKLKVMKIRTKWSRFARKLLTIDANSKGLDTSVRWNYLSNKMVAKHQRELSLQKLLTISTQWNYMSNKLVAKQRIRKCLQRRFKWVYLSRKLLMKQQIEDNTVQKRWTRILLKIKSRILMNELYKIQIYDNWETLTSRIRMNDVKRRFLEQNNHWYRFTKALRLLDLKSKIPFYREEFINKIAVVVSPKNLQESEPTQEGNVKNWRIDKLTNSAPQRNWFKIIKALRKKMYSKVFFEGYSSVKEVYPESEEGQDEEEQEERRTPADERWFILVRGLRKKQLSLQFKISSQDWLRFTMGLRKLDRKSLVQRQNNPWFIFTMGLRVKEMERQKIFSNDWLRYTMGIRRMDLHRRFRLSVNHWTRFTMRLRLQHNKKIMFGDDSDNVEEAPSNRVYSSHWKDITKKLRFRELQYRLHDIQNSDPQYRAYANLSRLARLYVKMVTKQNHERYFKATTGLARLMRQYIQHVNRIRMQSAFGGNTNLARLARRYLAKCNREQSFKNQMRWKRLANKILGNQVESIRDKRLRVAGRWFILAKGLKQIPLNRRVHLSTSWARFSQKLIIRDNKIQALQNIARWRQLIQGILSEDYMSKPLEYTPIERWQTVIQKLLHKEKQNAKLQTASWIEGHKVMKDKILDHNKKGKQMLSLNKWIRLIRGILAQEKEAHAERIQQRWNNLMSKFFQDLSASNPKGQLGLELFSKLSNDATDKDARKQSKEKSSKKDKQQMRPEVVKRWEKTTSKLRLHSWQQLMAKFQVQKNVLKRWNKLMTQLMKKNPSVGFNGKFISKLVQSADKPDNNNTEQNQMPPQQLSDIEERWERVVSEMLFRNNKESMGTRIKKFVQIVREIQEQTQQNIVEQSVDSSQKPPLAFGKTGGSSRTSSQVMNVKLKTIKVKNADRVKKQLQDSKDNLMNMSRSIPNSVAASESNQDGTEVIHQLQHQNRILRQEFQVLQSKMSQHKQILSKKKNELDQKNKNLQDEVEQGKQRENKLMFFLYVLKEEKKCLVTDVFEEYIKPIETGRFISDYGEDFKQVLKKIKNEQKYDKVYGKALRKMRLLTNGKEYQSDSCLPIYCTQKEQEESKYRGKIQEEQLIKPRSKTQFPVIKMKGGRKVVQITNTKKKTQVQIPTFDLVKLGQNQRIPILNHFVMGQDMQEERPHEQQQYGDHQDAQNYTQENDIDMQYYGSSSSEDSKAKAKIKDIVFEPRQRKRLLDSLNIVTPNHKRQALHDTEEEESQI